MREIRNKGKLTVALSMALMMVMAGCAKTETNYIHDNCTYGDKSS